jgi:hypothetical protein
MTVQELIELLEGCNPEAEVQLAHQPAWPLASLLHGVVADDSEADASSGSSPVIIRMIPRTRRTACGMRRSGHDVMRGRAVEHGQPWAGDPMTRN